MKNLTTQEFCEKYPAGIMEGHFIMKFETMRDCYAALLRGEEGNRHSAEWAIQIIGQTGVLAPKTLVKFACRCARQAWGRMTDERSRRAVEVAEAWADGLATDSERETAVVTAWAAAGDAAQHATSFCCDVAWAAAYVAWAAVHAADHAYDAVYAASYAAAYAVADVRVAARAEQLEFLRELGNPFEE